MTTAQKRSSLINRIGRYIPGSDMFTRSTPARPRISDAQRSYLIDCGLPHDASDDDVARFAQSLDDFTRAEYDALSDTIEDFGSTEVTRGQGEGQTGGTQQRTGAQAGQQTTEPQTLVARLSSTDDHPDSDIQRQIDEGIARALEQQNAAEQERRELIRSLDGDDIPRDIVNRAYTEGWPQERIQREFMTAIRNRPRPVDRAPAGHTTSPTARRTLQSLQAGLLLREGVSLDDPILRTMQAQAMLRQRDSNAAWLYQVNSENEVARMNAEDRGNLERQRDNAHEFAGMSLLGFCRAALELHGRPIPTSDEELVRTAMSTSTLSAVFSTSVNMQILQAYMMKPDTTMGWTYETDVNGFHVQQRGRLTKGSGVKKLARGGVPEDIQIGDATETYAAARYAGRFVIDEQDIIDNTLGGLSEHTTRELGELCKEIKIALVIAILLSNPTMRDGTALFHASHGNTATGLGWSLASYRTVRTAMSKQTENGRLLNCSLAHVIAPEDLDFDVRQLLRSGELRQAADSTGGQMGIQNPAQNTATPHFDARLAVGVTNPDDETFYAGSTTTWFGCSDQGRHGIEVGWRRGTGRAPRIESGRLPISDGYGYVYRANVDVGAKAIDWRGLYRAQVS